MSTRFKLHNDGITHAMTGDDIQPGLEWESTLPPLALRFDSAMFAAGARRTTVDGQKLPPWYYGLAYVDIMRHVFVFYLFPLHLIVRAVRWFSYRWNRIRASRSWFDRALLKALHEHHGWVRHGLRTAEEDAALSKALGIPLNPSRSEQLRRMRVVHFNEGPTATIELLEGPHAGEQIDILKTKLVLS